MKRAGNALLLALSAVAPAWAAPLSAKSNSGPIVELDYATYQGYYNNTWDLNVWKSVRYAAPPTGNLRWQAPQPPPTSSGITPAVDQPPWCPQAGAYGTPAVYGFNSGLGNEDCLYLNVWAPPGAKDLPVYVWIHGGGYSVFGAVYDPSEMMATNDNGFIFVELQYRLGAFGWASSEDIKKNGVLNAGLLDQRFALEWVQKYISKFGGDPSRVTLGGESGGATSIMQQSLAYGGNGSSLFQNIILASPSILPSYEYNSTIPTKYYDAFAEQAGCGGSSDVFKCLVETDTDTLQNASGIVSTTMGYFGSFAWFPVVDGDFISERPTVMLQNTEMAGQRMLVSNNANEGIPLINPFINTLDEFDDFISAAYPGLSTEQVSTLNSVYNTKNALPGNNGTRFDTLGDCGPTANTQSAMATGIQQTAFNLAAEGTFHCPGQWVAETFSSQSKPTWVYQYSTEANYHGGDLLSYFIFQGAVTPPADFRHAFQKIWGNFVINNSPVISMADATGGYQNATVPRSPSNPDEMAWPEYSVENATFISLNITGGEPEWINVNNGELIYPVRTGSGMVNSFKLANAYSWEGGRGVRCDTFWREVAANIPY